MAIKKRDRAKIDLQPFSDKEKEFVESVDDNRGEGPPWESFEPSEKFVPKNQKNNQGQLGAAINVKFNRYQHEMLKFVSKMENRSIHGQIKFLINQALEDAVKNHKQS